MREAIVLAGEAVRPGRRTRVELPAARLATGSPLSMPVEVVHGRRKGPSLWLSSTLHGDELNGIEIIRRVLSEVDARTFRGTLMAVPIVNVLGFLTESRYLPDRRDLNRSFPGSPRGSLASRLAHLLMTEVVSQADYGIDLHTGSLERANLPQIRGDLRDPKTRELARAFAAPVAVQASVRDGSLRAAATELGAKVLVYEGGEARRFNPEAVETGVAGVLRIMEALGMREGAPPAGDSLLEAERSSWVRAGRSGLARLTVGLGDRVTRGHRVGVIRDAFGNHTLRVRASRAGIVIGVNRHALVNRGDALVHVAESQG